jgi:hypothetical protein
LFVYRGHPDAVRKAFDSEKEWRRWLALLEELKAGAIQGLRKQRRFWLHGPNGARITSWVADFTYIRNGKLIAEDVKSEMTRKLPTYRVKKAWVLDEYGIDILET